MYYNIQTLWPVHICVDSSHTYFNSGTWHIKHLHLISYKRIEVCYNYIKKLYKWSGKGVLNRCMLSKKGWCNSHATHTCTCMYISWILYKHSWMSCDYMYIHTYMYRQCTHHHCCHCSPHRNTQYNGLILSLPLYLSHTHTSMKKVCVFWRICCSSMRSSRFLFRVSLLTLISFTSASRTSNLDSKSIISDKINVQWWKHGYEATCMYMYPQVNHIMYF